MAGDPHWLHVHLNPIHSIRIDFYHSETNMACVRCPSFSEHYRLILFSLARCGCSAGPFLSPVELGLKSAHRKNEKLRPTERMVTACTFVPLNLNDSEAINHDDYIDLDCFCVRRWLGGPRVCSAVRSPQARLCRQSLMHGN